MNYLLFEELLICFVHRLRFLANISIQMFGSRMIVLQTYLFDKLPVPVRVVGLMLKNDETLLLSLVPSFCEDGQKPVCLQ